MALDKLYIPTNNAKMAVIDISTITAPVLGTALSLPSATAGQTVAVDSSANVFVADKITGRVYKFNQVGTLLLNTTHVQGGEGPNSLVVDGNDSVWAFYGNGEPTLKLTNVALAVEATETTAVGNLTGVGAYEGYDAVLCYDNNTGIIHRINTTTNLVVASLDLDDLLTVPGTLATAADEITQIASAGDKAYVAISLEPASVDPYALVVIDLDTNTVVAGDTIDMVESTCVFADGSNVYVADKSSRIHKYSNTGGLLASFNVPTTMGRICYMSASNTPGYLIVIDDGFFSGRVNYHILDEATGIVVFTEEIADSLAGREIAGDFTGYQRFDIITTATPPFPAPIIEADGICAFVRMDGRIDVFGPAGTAKNITSIDVELTVGPVTIITGIVPQADYSFSGYTSATPGDPAGFESLTITFTGAGGSATATVLTFPKVQRFCEQKHFEEDTEESLAELIARPVDILGAKLSDIQDWSTWGGFMARRMQQVYRLVYCLQAHITAFKDIAISGISVTASQYYVFQGDTPTINFTVRGNETGLIEDITGATVEFVVYNALQGNIIIFSKECEVLSGTYGACETTLTSTDTAASGGFYGVVRVTFPGGEILTSPRFNWNVQPTP